MRRTKIRHKFRKKVRTRKTNKQKSRKKLRTRKTNKRVKKKQSRYRSRHLEGGGGDGDSTQDKLVGPMAVTRKEGEAPMSLPVTTENVTTMFGLYLPNNKIDNTNNIFIGFAVEKERKGETFIIYDTALHTFYYYDLDKKLLVNNHPHPSSLEIITKPTLTHKEFANMKLRFKRLFEHLFSVKFNLQFSGDVTISLNPPYFESKLGDKIINHISLEHNAKDKHLYAYGFERKNKEGKTYYVPRIILKDKKGNFFLSLRGEIIQITSNYVIELWESGLRIYDKTTTKGVFLVSEPS